MGPTKTKTHMHGFYKCRSQSFTRKNSHRIGEIQTFRLCFFIEKLLLHGLSCDARITIQLKIQRKFQTLAFLWILLKQYTYSFEVVFLTEVYFTEIESKIENAKVSTRACAKNLNSKSTLFRSEMTIITSFIKYCWLKNRVGENLGF